MITSSQQPSYDSYDSHAWATAGSAVWAVQASLADAGAGLPLAATAPVAPGTVVARPAKSGRRRRAGLKMATRPDTPAAQRQRFRKVPDRLVSLARLRLAQGLEFVRPEGNFSAGYRLAKRALDILGALALLSVLWPIMLAAYVALWFTTGGRPIFRQVRLGYRGRPFTMYKFRTMVADAARRQHTVANEKDGPIFKNRRDPRVTRLGRLLRSTSIDEMPQLFNVLCGQMSLVGPRPPLAKEVAQYKPWQRRRLSVKPGLTCLWQVSGRSEIGFEQWVRMDLWYVRHQSLLTDLKLLAKTPWSVLSRRGAY